MKIKKTELKTAETAYLYEDGHLILVHKKNDKDAGELNWVTAYEHVGIKTHFNGRLIIDKGALPFVLHATKISAKAADINRGSENTRRLGLAVGSVILYNGTDYGFCISLMPYVISSDIEYQYDTSETWNDIKDSNFWGSYTIKQAYCNNN